MILSNMLASIRNATRPLYVKARENLRLSKEDKVHQHELRASRPILTIRRILTLRLLLDLLLFLLLFLDRRHYVIFAQILDRYQRPCPSVKSQHFASSEQPTRKDK